MPGLGRVSFSILGSLQIWHDGGDCTPKTPKVLQVLALMLMRANRVVETDSLIQELWGENAPRSALTTVQTYICQLRKMIQRKQLAENGDEMLVTRTPGYLLRVPAGQLDLQRFWNLRQQSREYFAQRQFAEASSGFRAALQLWTGKPLANVKLGARLSAHVVDLQEQQRNALQLAIESEMELGLHRELIAELRSLNSIYPTDEWICRQLMRALDHSGRRGDALWLYRSLQRALGDELGIDPSRETQELYRELLE